MATAIEYDRIMANLKNARESGDKRRVTIWRNKLQKWRLEYGAHTPIGK